MRQLRPARAVRDDERRTWWPGAERVAGNAPVGVGVATRGVEEGARTNNKQQQQQQERWSAAPGGRAGEDAKGVRATRE